MKPLLMIGAVGACLAVLNQALTGEGGQDAARALAVLLVQVAQMALTLAYVRVGLLFTDGRPLDLSRPGNLLADFLTFLLTSVLYGLVVGVGLVLLIVPGVLWAIQFGFSGYLVADKKLDPLEAMRASARLTRGLKGKLLGFGALLLGTNIVGALALGVGLLVTVPTTAIAAAYVLRRLQARAGERGEQKPAVSAPHVPSPTPAG